MPDETSPEEKTKAKMRRPWVAPAIVATQQAFEHSILACTGRPGRSPNCNAAVRPKGQCVTVCVASS
jgi:hypothetical protein